MIVNLFCVISIWPVVSVIVEVAQAGAAAVNPLMSIVPPEAVAAAAARRLPAPASWQLTTEIAQADSGSNMSVAATQAARGLRGHALEQISPLARIAFSGRPTALQFTPCQLGNSGHGYRP